MKPSSAPAENLLSVPPNFQNLLKFRRPKTEFFSHSRSAPITGEEKCLPGVFWSTSRPVFFLLTISGTIGLTASLQTAPLPASLDPYFAKLKITGKSSKTAKITYVTMIVRHCNKKKMSHQIHQNPSRRTSKLLIGESNERKRLSTTNFSKRPLVGRVSPAKMSTPIRTSELWPWNLHANRNTKNTWEILNVAEHRWRDSGRNFILSVKQKISGTPEVQSVTNKILSYTGNQLLSTILFWNIQLSSCNISVGLFFRLSGKIPSSQIYCFTNKVGIFSYHSRDF